MRAEDDERRLHLHGRLDDRVGRAAPADLRRRRHAPLLGRAPHLARRLRVASSHSFWSSRRGRGARRPRRKPGPARRGRGGGGSSRPARRRATRRERRRGRRRRRSRSRRGSSSGTVRGSSGVGMRDSSLIRPKDGASRPVFPPRRPPSAAVGRRAAAGRRARRVGRARPRRRTSRRRALRSNAKTIGPYGSSRQEVGRGEAGLGVEEDEVGPLAHLDRAASSPRPSAAAPSAVAIRTTCHAVRGALGPEATFGRRAASRISEKGSSRSLHGRAVGAERHADPAGEVVGDGADAGGELQVRGRAVRDGGPVGRRGARARPRPCG